MKYISNKQEGAERHVALVDAKVTSPVHNRRTTETDRYRLDYESPTVFFCPLKYNQGYKRLSHAPRLEKPGSNIGLNNFLESHKARVLQEQEKQYYYKISNIPKRKCSLHRRESPKLDGKDQHKP
jgi:hypothetical protein